MKCEVLTRPRKNPMAQVEMGLGVRIRNNWSQAMRLAGFIGFRPGDFFAGRDRGQRRNPEVHPHRLVFTEENGRIGDLDGDT